MAGKRSKRQADWDDDENQFTQKAASKQDNSEEEEESEVDDDDQDLDLASIAESTTPRGPTEPDSREVDSLTDRIFGSVLSRYGWERRGDRIEHVGEERRRNRQ